MTTKTTAASLPDVRQRAVRLALKGGRSPTSMGGQPLLSKRLACIHTMDETIGTLVELSRDLSL